MQVVVIGNGAIGLTIAWQILKDYDNAKVFVVGKTSRIGCASIAAAAMFNSFAEIDAGTLSNAVERVKWLFNHEASILWPSLIELLRDETGKVINHGFGTFVINNHVSDNLEDENFDAIVSALKEFEEPYELISPRLIPGYKPSCQARAGRCVHIPREGWINPLNLLEALQHSLFLSNRVELVDADCVSLSEDHVGNITSIQTDRQTTISGDVFILCPGARFSRIIEASNLSVRFPRIFYGSGCTIVLETGESTLSNCIRTPNRGLACGVYSAPRDQDHTIVGASNLVSPVGLANAQVGSVYTLLKSAMEQLNTDFYRAGLSAVNLGWRPTSEDTVPLIGRSEINNLMVVTGTKRDGLHCSPLIAKCISELLESKSCSFFDLSLFNPNRSRIRLLSRAESVDNYVKHCMNANYQHDFVPAKNRMVETLQTAYRDEIEKLHDQVGAYDWGIPAEMVNMYRYGHLK
jgi:glycine oxidase